MKIKILDLVMKDAKHVIMVEMEMKTIVHHVILIIF